jgi:hypothetical protein
MVLNVARYRSVIARAPLLRQKMIGDYPKRSVQMASIDGDDLARPDGDLRSDPFTRQYASTISTIRSAAWPSQRGGAPSRRGG